jgi:holo-[acyl-carrier protein] synthase
MSMPTAALLGDIGTWISDSFPRVSADGGPKDRSSSLRVGVDLASVADVVESVERFGDRYVHRIFTPHEIGCCLSDGSRGGVAPRYSFESLAARFAAKEATLKVLRPVGPRPEWRHIEVVRDGSGWCEIHLTGKAADMAAEAGIEQWAVSLTHHASMAAAVVVGICGPDGDGHSRRARRGQGRNRQGRNGR